jgi:putative heme-binding domain-containing protein
VIPRDELQKMLGGFGEAFKHELQATLLRPNPARQEQAGRLEELLGSLPTGDVRRGQIVFHSAKAACFSCHEMGYRGGQIGPDLTRIGQIRNRRDLLEAIVFPSASFVRSYEPMRVTTSRGVTFNGVVRDQTAREIVLFDEQQQERRIPLADVESIEPSPVSVMPSGLDQLLTPQELADVITFLEAAR